MRLIPICSGAGREALALPASKAAVMNRVGEKKMFVFKSVFHLVLP